VSSRQAFRTHARACASRLPATHTHGVHLVLVAPSAALRYVGAFPLLLVVTDPSSQIAIAIFGGAIGGVAAGFLWTAQGAYFTTSARLYAEAHDDGTVTPKQATATFAALFGATYLGFELILKLAPLLITIVEDMGGSGGEVNASAAFPPPPPPPYLPGLTPPSSPSLPSEEPNGSGRYVPKTSDVVIAVLYSICSILSSVGMTTIWDLERRQSALTMNGDASSGRPAPSSSTSSPAPPPTPKFSIERLMSAVLLWYKRPDVLLLSPVQITFGFCAALLGLVVGHQVVPKAFPGRVATAASCLSAMVALIAALLQVSASECD
jgi:hypothetical protein